MDYEKKYKETLEAVKHLAEANPYDEGIQNWINDNFPELKMSEDERIRRAILTGLIDCRDAPDLGWSNFGGIEIDECIDWLEKQGEQSLSDKVEPKFKEGECVIDVDCGKVLRISEILSKGYSFENGDYSSFDNANKEYRLWTIEDAKDGDVLVASDGSIFLFKCTIDCACKHYVALATDGTVIFNEGLEHFWETSRAVHPATKEQRDLLFQKMKESGYTWDSKKKEPIRI